MGSFSFASENEQTHSIECIHFNNDIDSLAPSTTTNNNASITQDDFSTCTILNDDTSSIHQSNAEAIPSPSAYENRLYESFKVAMKQSLSFHTSTIAAKLCCDPSKLSSTKSSSSSVPSTTEYEVTHPLIEYFKSNNLNKEKAWFSEIIKKHYYHSNNNIDPNPSSWKEKQRSIFFTCTSVLSGISSKNTSYFNGWTKILGHSFGVNKNHFARINASFIENDFSLARKKCSDTGSSIFNSPKKRKATFTSYNMYKKATYKEYRPYHEKIPEETIHLGFQNLDSEDRQYFDDVAQLNSDRSVTLWEELKDLLKKTHGKISYRMLARQLGGICCKNTIRNHLMRQEGFELKSDKIIPALTDAQRKKRFDWACTFWVFWKSATAVPVQKVRFVLLHLDEKWFYAYKRRCYNKILTSIGLTNKHVYVRNKSHIEKEMYVVATAFIPHENNDLTKGGKAVPIACIRCGELEVAKEDSHKRVYQEDGTFKYPKIPENRLREAGKTYFKSLELTGSSLESRGKKKVSLLQFYREQIIPALEEKVVNQLSENGTVKVVIVKQEDNAGLHKERNYVYQLSEEFKKRDWIIFNQPPLSPALNVHDSCIFPLMSKQVSGEQAVLFGNRVLVGEELNRTIMSVWNNDDNLCAISRAFIHHTQVVNSVLHYKGGNDYLHKKGGLHFGVRKTFLNDKDGEGVSIFEYAPKMEGETNIGQAMSDRIERGLRFEVPDVRDLFDNAKLQKDMLHILRPNIEHSLMSDDLVEVWYRLEEEA